MLQMLFKTMMPSKIIGIVLLLFLLGPVLPLGFAQCLNESVVSDSIGDVYDYNQLGIPAPPYEDLVGASVSRLDASDIRLEMRVGGSIPSSVEETHYVAYFWEFDTDRNPGTRMYVVNDIGIDVGVRVRYEPRMRDWIADVGTAQQPSREIPRSTFLVSANTVIVILSLADLGNPSSFDWVASSIEYWIDRKDKPNYHDHAPSEGHASYDLAAVSCATVRTVTSTQISAYTETRMSVRTETVQALFGPLSLTDALLLVALVVLAPAAYVVGRRTRKPVSVAELPRAGLFEVSVTVPSAGKTVSIEAGPDHTVGSLVETLASTLNLPEGRAYAVEYAGKLVSQPDFGKSLAALGIKEGSKLGLRVVE